MRTLPGRERRAGVAVGRVLLGILKLFLVALALWGLLLLAIVSYGRQDYARAADAIVVLGAAQYDGRPSPVLRARLDHAVVLYHQGIAPVVITTGGVGIGDTVSEATVGRRYLIRQGLPPAALLSEQQGVRTVESMRAVAQLMRDQELNSAVLISDPFHVLRLRIMAARLRIRAFTSPTRTSPISADPAQEWRYILRESGIIVLMLVPGDF